MLPQRIDADIYREMGMVGEFTRGRGMSKAQLTTEGVPAIHYGEIHTAYEISATETVSFVTPETAEKATMATPGSVVIVGKHHEFDPLGKGLAWLGEEEVAIGNGALAYETALHPEFVAYWLGSIHFKKQKWQLATGGGVSFGISLDDFQRVLIPVPPMDYQRAVVETLDELRDMTNEANGQLPATIARVKEATGYRKDELLRFGANV